VANREFFYILREMTKLQIYGCGGAPSGGWSGPWDMDLHSPVFFEGLIAVMIRYHNHIHNHNPGIIIIIIIINKWAKYVGK
jgi:hypothetical protein